MNNDTPWWRKPAVWIAAAFAFLLGLLAYEDHEKKAAQLDDNVAKDEAKDASLAQAQQDVQAQATENQAKIDDLKKSQANVKAAPMTPQEVSNYWNKKKL